ncbi:1,4-alpha-glucan branching protein GlgB [Geosporobacter ferrireducens]|uniref:1,4-alpha-glucan branching protein GlgB n=1 Tax=Geosporobacter ferrireducens TaxID=1424294 RepID=UPI00139BDB01|nr:1,4-alpha-glucan branching protein GlgB [Geosporobacter ferrireducens]MTI55511.1 1,4-alpha-glucan branching protein GlgB [Geosporobacter ferrireducens]
MKLQTISNFDLYLFHQGTHAHSYKFLGAHKTMDEDLEGVRFSLWAPNALQVAVVGDFNHWDPNGYQMTKTEESGIWNLFISGIQDGSLYKYLIYTQQGEILYKADPYGFSSEFRPGTASRISNLDTYGWQDKAWLSSKNSSAMYDSPMLIYEVHLGSWKRKADGSFYSYRDLAEELIPYVVNMGYTHIEILPLTEHPFDGSWGYQSTGYFAVTSRYGEPQDFMYFVDQCHQKEIGVILDWVPGHFCKDAHGLRQFDGTPLYEYANPMRAENFHWGTLSFDLGKPEVRSFLISNAIFWLDVFHIDGLRVDAVASMLYLDYGKEAGQWVPNIHGGKENLEAVDFMKKLNETVFSYFPCALMIAEESTQWPMVSKPTYLGGLGYNYKWNMGWMNDMLRYMQTDSIHRKWHHELLTFSLMYAFSENFILPLSHDEVVHGKKSLLNKMPGDYWQKFASLRAFYGYMIAHPGKKLIFMGGEFGQFIEWDEQKGLDWFLLDYDMHRKLHLYVEKLNCLYRQESALWTYDHDWQGFQWIDPHDYQHSIITFMRMGKDPEAFIIILCNFTPIVYDNYRIGVPKKGHYVELFNSDMVCFGGSGQSNHCTLAADSQPWHSQPHSIVLKVPPLATLFLKYQKPSANPMEEC